MFSLDYESSLSTCDILNFIYVEDIIFKTDNSWGVVKFKACLVDVVILIHDYLGPLANRKFLSNLWLVVLIFKINHGRRAFTFNHL